MRVPIACGIFPAFACLYLRLEILDWQSLLLMALLTSPQSPFFLQITGKNQRAMMDWQHRMKIAIGAAHGLASLHEDCYPRIIHRGIKSSNILLHFNLEPMIANFGLAKLAFDSFTNVSTTLIGTFGYLALEYASSRKLIDKSYVFSFGGMLLELITGLREVDSPASFTKGSLVDWAQPTLTRALEDDNVDEHVDCQLQN
ncbi:proline-rich receptor-like protein kinase PERK4 isoform X2 [Cryptomeria japonica]|uniref:proline-rich receptor-like protein kinase PERK4 isoform X2 n=1 Tax=Cryptomeria japonica TaxID=3369 RepID=UPI0027DAA505|nr:proline-rich receptor-like protein kinase PERK4 isoform X2 [Cryptomeria japonica]